MSEYKYAGIELTPNIFAELLILLFDHDKQRGSWNGVVPVTRVIPNKRAYDRNRAKQADRSIRTSEG